MASTKQRIPLAEAEALAAQVVALLSPSCERIEIAGSIRRRKAEVGDIEIVCVPTLESRVVRDLFGNETVTGQWDALTTLVAARRAVGVFRDRLDVNGRPAFGDRYKRLTFEGIGLDLFSVLPPAQFGVIFTIRTGCAEFSHKLVTPRLQGGWLPAGTQVKDGALWDRGAVVPTPQEADLFAAVGLPWLEPEQRTATVRLAKDTGRGWKWIDPAPRREAVPA